MPDYAPDEIATYLEDRWAELAELAGKAIHDPGCRWWGGVTSAYGDVEVLCENLPGQPMPPNVHAGNWSQVLAWEPVDECEQIDHAWHVTLSRHIAAHGPHYVLCDIAAKREMLARARMLRAEADRLAASMPDVRALELQVAVVAVMRNQATALEKLLAAPFARHPGFLPSWQLSPRA